MKARQAGFTLIELVVVIVILGILAATALPKFVDLKGEAAQAAAQGAAGAMSSAASLNYAGYMVNSTKAGIVRLSAAAAGASLVSGGALTWDSAKFSISADATCGTSAGATAGVTILSRDDTTKSATATIVCTG